MTIFDQLELTFCAFIYFSYLFWGSPIDNPLLIRLNKLTTRDLNKEASHIV